MLVISGSGKVFLSSVFYPPYPSFVSFYSSSYFFLNASWVFFIPFTVFFLALGGSCCISYWGFPSPCFFVHFFSWVRTIIQFAGEFLSPPPFLLPTLHTSQFCILDIFSLPGLSHMAQHLYY